MSKYLLLWGCSENVIKLELNFRFKLVINGVKQYLSGKPEIIITGENGKNAIGDLEPFKSNIERRKETSE